ncbi:hypothetical protein Q9306_22565 [Bacillus sp. WLY-B-L8]|nr:hypothetical protein [Bacillus sp. WLY-B-L8]
MLKQSEQTSSTSLFMIHSNDLSVGKLTWTYIETVRALKKAIKREKEDNSLLYRALSSF